MTMRELAGVKAMVELMAETLKNAKSDWYGDTLVITVNDLDENNNEIFKLYNEDVINTFKSSMKAMCDHQLIGQPTTYVFNGFTVVLTYTSYNI